MAPPPSFPEILYLAYLKAEGGQKARSFLVTGNNNDNKRPIRSSKCAVLVVWSLSHRSSEKPAVKDDICAHVITDPTARDGTAASYFIT